MAINKCIKSLLLGYKVPEIMKEYMFLYIGAIQALVPQNTLCICGLIQQRLFSHESKVRNMYLNSTCVS